MFSEGGGGENLVELLTEAELFFCLFLFFFVTEGLSRAFEKNCKIARADGLSG